MTEIRFEVKHLKRDKNDMQKQLGALNDKISGLNDKIYELEYVEFVLLFYICSNKLF